ncbi:UNVERIFIED_ORG: hypothetical protein JN05_04514 [Zoogloea ramigera]|uniref:DUF1795 domain-containing protein n=1 Tax=Duganella zoogloeoides TaxID=75659 RepID=A0ABZ0XZQ8_9BURK|nr:hypothetical protein [Duganella zoogloeoides]WQH04657.1 hypothetical protein SR858_27065 [Duganella zoogloeoides]
MNRRHHLAALAALVLGARGVLAEPKRALRQMQIHKVRELGLEIWVENQPPWNTTLSTQTGRPTFVAQSPDAYHPPTVMTYMSWPGANSPDSTLSTMATTAIRGASQNFGLTLGQARALQPVRAEYGVLRGFEAAFDGTGQGQALDVMMFVGQAPGKFPVVLNIYTMRGKMGSLTEHRRRAWTRISYL